MKKKKSTILNFFRVVVYTTGLANNVLAIQGHYSSTSNINSPLHAKIHFSSNCLEKKYWVLSTNHSVFSIVVHTIIKKLSSLDQ